MMERRALWALCVAVTASSLWIVSRRHERANAAEGLAAGGLVDRVRRLEDAVRTLDASLVELRTSTSQRIDEIGPSLTLSRSVPVEAWEPGVPYEAATDGWLHATDYPHEHEGHVLRHGYWWGWTGSQPDRLERVAHEGFIWPETPGGAVDGGTWSMWVKKGDYWRIDIHPPELKRTLRVYWTPVGGKR